MIAVYFILGWLALGGSVYLGWYLRGRLPTQTVTQLPSHAVIASNPEQQERIETDKKEAVLTQWLQQEALKSGRHLSPMDAAQEARDLLQTL